jgi:hypothetical protein
VIARNGDRLGTGRRHRALPSERAIIGDVERRSNEDRPNQKDSAKMCRNIRTLFNFEPPASEEEIRASALQFVRKLSGFAKPSRANEAAFNRAVDEVTETARRLLRSLETASPARNREIEAAKARARARERYA